MLIQIMHWFVMPWVAQAAPFFSSSKTIPQNRHIRSVNAADSELACCCCSANHATLGLCASCTPRLTHPASQRAMQVHASTDTLACIKRFQSSDYCTRPQSTLQHAIANTQLHPLLHPGSTHWTVTQHQWHSSVQLHILHSPRSHFSNNYAGLSKKQPTAPLRPTAPASHAFIRLPLTAGCTVGSSSVIRSSLL